MAPIKFEETIKETLENRAIEPSTNAWNKLQVELDKDEEIPSKKSYWWLGIAASFIGLLMISIVMLKNTTTNNTEVTPVIVQEEVEINKNLEPVIKEVVEVKEAIKIAKEQVVKQQLSPSIKKETLVVTAQKTNSVINNKATKEYPTPNVIKEQDNVVVVITEAEQGITQKSITELKVDEVVAKIQDMQRAVNGVTDAEIDSLLRQAQKDIFSKRLYNAKTKTVNAELLLLDVEEELNQSFRDKVFEALKSSYKKAKTAVAERNN